MKAWRQSCHPWLLKKLRTILIGGRSTPGRRWTPIEASVQEDVVRSGRSDVILPQQEAWRQAWLASFTISRANARDGPRGRRWPHWLRWTVIGQAGRSINLPLRRLALVRSPRHRAPYQCRGPCTCCKPTSPGHRDISRWILAHGFLSTSPIETSYPLPPMTSSCT